jgi:hypothetical protein
VPLPPDLPPVWLRTELADCVVRFVHSDYCGQTRDLELARVFAPARNVSVDAMPLRAIFLAIAKSGRIHDHPAESPSPTPEKGTEA